MFSLRAAVKSRLALGDPHFVRLPHEKWLFPAPGRGDKVEVLGEV